MSVHSDACEEEGGGGGGSLSPQPHFQRTTAVVVHIGKVACADNGNGRLCDDIIVRCISGSRLG